MAVTYFDLHACVTTAEGATTEPLLQTTEEITMAVGPRST
jgi:hypothetical protein